MKLSFVNFTKHIFMGAMCLTMLFTLSESAFASTSSKTIISKKTSTAKRSASTGAAIQNLLNNPDSAVWVRKGKSGIIISKDSLGLVRALTPSSVNSAAARRYAEMVNRYAAALKDDGVRVYACPVPSQGDYYMPEIAGSQGNERKNIYIAAEALDPGVTMVYICDTLANHTAEEIYNRTDHHWSPLGGYYGAKALAEAAGVYFRPLSDYTTDTVPNYVGTMYKYSGDPQVNKYPENFVYFMPPEGYESEFIMYNVTKGKTTGEGKPYKSNFFKRFTGASSYCTFMGGDLYTVKVTNTGGTPGRKLLIVKDSFGNAMPSNLFGSFEEVHVIDFRYFPHNLLDYVRDNGITDLALVNAIVMAVSPTWQNRYDIMFNAKSKHKVSTGEDEAEEATDSAE